VQAQAREAYLELLKQCLTRALVVGEGHSPGRRRRAIALVFAALGRRGFVVVPDVPSRAGHAVRSVRRLPGSRILARLLARRGLAIVPDASIGSVVSASPQPRRRMHPGRRLRDCDRRLARVEREFGLDWPAHAETMVGLRRLENVQRCVVDVLEREVRGDLIEAGVWRGGTAIFMRGLLAAFGANDRRVWVADSFAGLPKPRPDAYPSDAGLDYTIYPQLAVGMQQVKANFARYQLLDDQVCFLPGWFSETLAAAPIEAIAVMRLDGDLYESTMDALVALYPKLSVGGYCIIDDFGALPACRRAVEEYRRTHGITEEILTVGDWTGAYWRRAGTD
jgi:O-methyltransferase